MVIIKYFLFLFYPDIFIPPPSTTTTNTNTDRLIFTKVYQNVRLKGTTFRGYSLFLSGGFLKQPNLLGYGATSVELRYNWCENEAN